MKLRVLEGEHFTCRSCTNCCRGWHVELSAIEAERIRRLPWAPPDDLAGSDVIIHHSGRMLLAHRSDGACVFLNPANGLCRIHERFGAHAKPIGCRLFPFQVHQTFSGEVSVIGRYDCPTIRQNLGAPHLEYLPLLKELERQVELPAGFDEAICYRFDRDQIQAAVDFACTMLGGFADDPRRAMFIVVLSAWLSTLPADELNRAALASALPFLKAAVEASMETQGRPTLLDRLAFRTLLGLYLRRDEDVLDRRANRTGRAVAMAAVVVGYGGFHRLGMTHPRGSLRRTRLFQLSIQPHEPRLFDLFWRMVRNRLESFQFMGSANGGRDFLEGLRSLALLYPLVLAAARYACVNRGAGRLEVSDVDYAVAAIEHSFGRQPMLNARPMRSLERRLVQPLTFARLVQGI